MENVKEILGEITKAVDNGKISLGEVGTLKSLTSTFEEIVHKYDGNINDFEKGQLTYIPKVQREKDMKFETLLIINPEVTTERIKITIGNIDDIITSNNGKLDDVECIGIKQLAYKIKKNKKGYYVIFHWSSEDTKCDFIDKYCRIDEDVLKFLTIRVNE